MRTTGKRPIFPQRPKQRRWPCLADSQVLFNVLRARGKVSLGGNYILGGMLMANNRTIELMGEATVSGEILLTGLSFADRSVFFIQQLVHSHTPKDYIEDSDLTFRWCMCDTRMLTRVIAAKAVLALAI